MDESLTIGKPGEGGDSLICDMRSLMETLNPRDQMQHSEKTDSRAWVKLFLRYEQATINSGTDSVSTPSHPNPSRNTPQYTTT